MDDSLLTLPCEIIKAAFAAFFIELVLYGQTHRRRHHLDSTHHYFCVDLGLWFCRPLRARPLEK